MLLHVGLIWRSFTANLAGVRDAHARRVEVRYQIFVDFVLADIKLTCKNIQLFVYIWIFSQFSCFVYMHRHGIVEAASIQPGIDAAI